MTKLRATARLQLHKDFRFGDAVPLLDYYAKLGVSHVYVSPILKARPGSIHGYDVIDHTEINPELGGEPAFRRFVGALRALNLGLIVDIVPNHMCVSDSGNRWWADILEWGPESPYADFFDIDWHPADAALRNKVHMPFLGKPYGTALADGDLSLRFEAESGTFRIAYFDHSFPVSPRSESLLLGAASSPKLTAIADGLASAMTSSEPRVRVAELRAALAETARAGSRA
jgi:(1->4)-alpha-D-glucan 1-alpha-D-glucosylmutase